MGRVIKHYCNVCKSEAQQLQIEGSGDYQKIHYACKNPECKHKFVMIRTFSHTTRESDLTRTQSVEAEAANLKQTEE